MNEIHVAHLLPVLHKKLIELLKSLPPQDWERQSIAKLWKVKDIVAHLLDGNIRSLSMLRDEYFGEKPGDQPLLHFLNELNADWVRAMKRVSPQMLICLHEATGDQYCAYYTSLDPFAKAGFSVAWAGETESKNWMHTAREYTEKWLHQQQIRETIGDRTLLVKEFYYPLLDTFMRALPFAYRDVAAEENTVVAVKITGDAGGTWFIEKESEGWQLTHNAVTVPAASVTIDADVAWKLFSKSVRPDDVRHHIFITGDESLTTPALYMISVMA